MELDSGCILKVGSSYFPGPVGKNLPCNAGDVSSIPRQGTKTPHATEQLSPHATTRDSVNCNKRSHLLQLNPNSAKYINKYFKILNKVKRMDGI